MESQWNTYLQNIHSRSGEILSTVIAWSCQNSHTDHLDGLSSMLTLLKAAFKVLGGEQRLIDLPARKAVDEQGRLVFVPVGKALHIVKRPEAPHQILLAGHYDTVFAANSSFQQAVVEKERLRGPGVADMKGGLAILLHSLITLEQSPTSHTIGWEVLITPDEEVGSSSSQALYLEAAQRAQLGLIFEPAYPDGTLVSDRKGSTNLLVQIEGRSAHAGRDISQGRNAINALTEWLAHARHLEDTEKGITFNTGQIAGGHAFNVVPDHAFAKINLRHQHQDDSAYIEEHLQQADKRINAKEGFHLSRDTLALRAPKTLSKGTQNLFAHYQRCAEDLHFSLDWKPSGGVCDGNILAQAGLPCLDTLGAVGGGLHTFDEYLEIDSLTQRTCLTALFLLKLSAQHIPGFNRKDK